MIEMDRFFSQSTSGAESFFMAGLETTHISADALAYFLQRNQNANYASDRSTVVSVATDDYYSAIDYADDFFSLDEDDHSNYPTIPELSDSSDEEPEETIEPRDITMAGKGKNKGSSTFKTAAPTKPVVAKPALAPVPAPAPVPSPPAPVVEEKKVDAAETVYETAKGVWAWGKGVPVVSTFLGISETVAGKAVGLAGTNLGEIDGTIKPHLEKLDSGVLNPAIEAVVKIVLQTAGKTEDIVKPIIITLLTPLGMIKKDETPEVTAS